MATYYVRASMGNDGNTGLSPAQAWLTVDHAANNVAANDTVYIGAGTYREMVTIDTNGASGTEIVWVGDVTGENTGDPGLVVITAHDADDAAAVREYSLHMNFKSFNWWQDVVFAGGTIAAVGYNNALATTDWAYEGWRFTRCVMWASHSYSDRAFTVDLNDGLTPATSGLTWKQCVFVGECEIEYDGQAVANYDIKASAENCIFMPYIVTAYFGFHVDRLAVGANTIGGIDVTNGTFVTCNYAIQFEGVKNVAQPCTARNNLIIGAGFGVSGTNAGAGAVLEDFNIFHATASSTGGVVTSGGNSNSSVAPPLMGGLADISWYGLMGWSPWKPWEPIPPTPAIGFGASAYAPADDLYGNPRPMMRNTDDVGAVEARARGEEDTVTVHTAAASLKLAGGGYHDILVPVGTVLTTITAWGYYDANYAGNLPRMIVMNIPGVVDQTATMVAAAANWEELTVSFTPTSAGICRIRLESRDTSANGEMFWADAEVS